MYPVPNTILIMPQNLEALSLEQICTHVPRIISLLFWVWLSQILDYVPGTISLPIWVKLSQISEFVPMYPCTQNNFITLLAWIKPNFGLEEICTHVPSTQHNFDHASKFRGPLSWANLYPCTHVPGTISLLFWVGLNQISEFVPIYPCTQTNY